jgi:hypothetical protein
MIFTAEFMGRVFSWYVDNQSIILGSIAGMSWMSFDSLLAIAAPTFGSLSPMSSTGSTC